MNKIIFFNSKPYDIDFFTKEVNNLKNNNGQKLDIEFNIEFIKDGLNYSTVNLAKGADAICIFVNDKLDKDTLLKLAKYNIKVIALRCAGFNNVDIEEAAKLNIPIVRVPAYSPYAVAELAAGLILNINRKIHKAYIRTRDNNFALDGLLGFDLHGKTAGIIGTGVIGRVMAKILTGFGMKVIGYDIHENTEAKKIGLEYVSLDNIYKQADIITLHCPLTPETKYLINSKALNQMKDNAIIINTSRGAIVDTNAIIYALKTKKIAGFGLDVYEHEGDLFFKDLSTEIVPDDLLSRLVTLPNVIITGHQGFFTNEAMSNIASTTIENISQILNNKPCTNIVHRELFN